MVTPKTTVCFQHQFSSSSRSSVVRWWHPQLEYPHANMVSSEFYAGFFYNLLFLLLMLWLLREQEFSWVGRRFWFYEQVSSVAISFALPFVEVLFGFLLPSCSAALTNLSCACSCRWGCSWLPLSRFRQFENTGSSFLLVFGNWS